MSFWAVVRGTVMAVAAILGTTDKEVCFRDHGIGCFRNEAPFDNARGLLPHSPDKIQLTFRLYTRRNRYVGQEVTYDTLYQSYYRTRRQTKFIIHGYRDDGRQSWLDRMKEALLDRGDYNVFCVDWEKGADQVDYNQAVANTRVVGALTASFIADLRRMAYLSYIHIHIIGHSLGAHIAGYAGKIDMNIARITGLDPAGLGFETRDVSVRLDKGDAAFVDVIHTDGEPLNALGFGLSKAIGHADYYPNGGEDQPGCKSVAPHVFKLITGKFKDFIKGIGCDHARARDLFIESIKTSCRFLAYPCPNEEAYEAGNCKICNSRCSRMGFNADMYPARGKYYLTTNKKSPFCQE